jgi:hypothetical protein
LKGRSSREVKRQKSKQISELYFRGIREIREPNYAI